MTRPTVLDMDLVVVPRDATDEMLGPANFGYSPDKFATIWDAMLSASPYPTAWDDVRKAYDELERENATAYELIGKTGLEPYVALKDRAEADEARIAELEKRLADAERVIDPFAKLGQAMRDSDKTSDRIAWGYNDADLTFGDCRAAGGEVMTDIVERLPLVCEAITEEYGEECAMFDPECLTCKVWAELRLSLSEARATGRREAGEECSKMLVNAAEQWEMYDEYERASEFRDLAAAIRAAMET